jgi:hypothetical protein
VSAVSAGSCSAHPTRIPSRAATHLLSADLESAGVIVGAIKLTGHARGEQEVRRTPQVKTCFRCRACQFHDTLWLALSARGQLGRSLVLAKTAALCPEAAAPRAA